MLFRLFVPGVFFLASCLIADAYAQDSILVDPKDFTRTPCEYRVGGCDRNSGARSPVPDNYVPSETGDVTMQLEDGDSLTVLVTLFEYQAQDGDETDLQVVATYSTLRRELRGAATRNAVFARLALVTETYGVDTAHVAACRSGGTDCTWSSFSRDPDGDWRVRD